MNPLAHGFARVHCDSCGHDRLVAFSCSPGLPERHLLTIHAVRNSANRSRLRASIENAVGSQVGPWDAGGGRVHRRVTTTRLITPEAVPAAATTRGVQARTSEMPLASIVALVFASALATAPKATMRPTSTSSNTSNETAEPMMRTSFLVHEKRSA